MWVHSWVGTQPSAVWVSSEGLEVAAKGEGVRVHEESGARPCTKEEEVTPGGLGGGPCCAWGGLFSRQWRQLGPMWSWQTRGAWV